MFLQLVMPSPGAPPSTLSALAQRSADSLFLYTPLQLSALIETVWRNRYNAASAHFTPWPQWMTDAILATNDPANVNPNFISGYTFPAPGAPGPFPLPGAGDPQWPVPLPSGGPFLAPNQLPGV